MIRVKLFGIAKDIVGDSKLEIDDGINSVPLLLSFLKQNYPDFNKLNSLLVAINSEYADHDAMISAEDEIAIIPPVSGG